MLQMYMMDNLHNATGQILMGAFITRSDRNHTGGYPVSTLTIGGELDGLCRVTRIAEAYYHSVLIAPDHAQVGVCVAWSTKQLTCLTLATPTPRHSLNRQ